MNKPVIKINVVSDVVCPWCYIGKRRLETAIDKLSNKYDFDIEYLPFELNPEMPSAGVNQKEYLSKKFGGEARYNQITGNTTSVAANEGLTFDFGRQEISPNTRNAHRLIQLAKQYGKQVELVEAFFKAYFTDGVNLASFDSLVALAGSCGMDEQEVRSLLQSETGIAEVEMTERQLQQLGISGVPFYIIDNKFGISGAQPPEAFIKAFEEIASAVPSGTEGAEACDVDKKNC
jgi:predicted DsbA family dithiol-disulfide isomerase